MTVVFIHGAFSRDGAWWWAPTTALLARSGLTSTAVALSSCGETGIAPTGAGPGLYEDAAATTAVLDEGEPTIIVAHSYGGMVASQAGEHPAVCYVDRDSVGRDAHGASRLCGRGSRGRGGGRAGVLGGPAELRTLGCLGSGEPAFERGLKLGVPAVSGPGALDPQPRLPPVDADGGELVVKSRLLHEPPADLGV